MRIIVGLGNPGEKYKLTRHNAGFMAIDALAADLNLSWDINKKFNGLIAKNNDLFLVKPQSYMNNSGQAVRIIMSYHNLLPKKLGWPKKDADLMNVLTVIHDDIDIALGKYKETADSRSAGHNGVQSIIDLLKTQKFTRFRLGIKNEKTALVPAEKFVLQKFSQEELNLLNQTIEKIVAAIKK